MSRVGAVLVGIFLPQATLAQQAEWPQKQFTSGKHRAVISDDMKYYAMHYAERIYDGNWVNGFPEGEGELTVAAFHFHCSGTFHTEVFKSRHQDEYILLISNPKFYDAAGREYMSVQGAYVLEMIVSRYKGHWGGQVSENNSAMFSGPPSPHSVVVENTNGLLRHNFYAARFENESGTTVELDALQFMVRPGNSYLFLIQANTQCRFRTKEGKQWSGNCVDYDKAGRPDLALIAGPQLDPATGKVSVDRKDLGDFLKVGNEWPEQDYFRFASGAGTMSYPDGSQVSGQFVSGLPVNNQPAHLTLSDGTTWTAYFSGGQLARANPTIATLSSKGTPCQGHVVMKGECADRLYKGDVEAWSRDGQRLIKGSFAAGKAKGKVTEINAATGMTLVGTADDEGEVISGQVLNGGKLVYEGPIAAGVPEGKGLCMYQGSPENCEYAMGGQRIDSLYKTRQENEKLRQENQKLMEKMEEKQASLDAREKQLNAQAAAVREAQAAARRSSSSGFDSIMKLGVLGTVAAISSGANVPAELKTKVITATATDLMNNGQSNASGQLLQQQIQAQAAASKDVGSGGANGSTAGYLSENYTFSCPSGNKPITLQLVARTPACMEAYKYYAKNFACNDDMEGAQEKCKAACGRIDCQQ